MCVCVCGGGGGLTGVFDVFFQYFTEGRTDLPQDATRGPTVPLLLEGDSYQYF